VPESYLRLGIDARPMKSGAEQADNSLNKVRRGARRTTREVDSTTRSFKRMQKGANGLTRVLGGLGGSLAFSMVLRETVQQFSEFERSLVSITALVGQSRRQVEEYKDAILDLAQALDVLEASAKAAAVGLGETKDIADAATSAVNAYGVENLSASAAVGTLVATVREGKLEASELSQVIGRIVPLAAEMGITFQQVGATIASLTRIGINTNEAATSTVNIFNNLLKPAAEAEELMASFGLTLGDVRENLRERGLLNTLLELKNLFGDNEEAMTQLFPSVRGLTGILALVGENAESNVEVMRALANETGGSLKKAYDDTEGSARELEQAQAELSTSLVRIGETTAPLAAKTMSDLASALTDVVAGMEAIGLIGRKSLPSEEELGPVNQFLKNVGDYVFQSPYDRIVQWGESLAEAINGPAEPLDRLQQQLELLELELFRAENGLADAFGTRPVEEIRRAIRALKGDMESLTPASNGPQLVDFQGTVGNAIAEGRADRFLRKDQSLEERRRATVFTQEEQALLEEAEKQYASVIGELETLEETKRIVERAFADNRGALEYRLIMEGLSEDAAQLREKLAEVQQSGQLLTQEDADTVADLRREFTPALVELEELTTAKETLDRAFAQGESIEGYGELVRRIQERMRELKDDLTGASEATTAFNELFDAGATAEDQFETKLDRIADLQVTLLENGYDRVEVEELVAKAIAKTTDEYKMQLADSIEATDRLEQIGMQAGDAITNSIERATFAADDLGSAFNNLLLQLAQIIYRIGVLGPLQESLGSSLGSFFNSGGSGSGGSRGGFGEALGGSVRKGDISMVGEFGKEMIMYPDDGYVFDANTTRRLEDAVTRVLSMSPGDMQAPQSVVIAGGGGSSGGGRALTPVQVQVNNYGKEEVQVEEGTGSDGQRILNITVGAVAQDIRQRGAVFKSLRETSRLNRR